MLLILQLLGSLGIFLFGMKLMSDALQKMAGGRLRGILNSLTGSRFRSFLSGLGITGLIQSSSATTVLTVGVAHAGLVSVKSVLPLVLGANVGTTLKFWIISWLGFSIDLTLLILPLAALSLPLFLIRKNSLRPVLYFSFGFILLFTGLMFIRQSVPDLTTIPDFHHFLEKISHLGFASVLLFVLLGWLITALLQSSSATMTLTVVLAYEGLIGYEYAVAMILGENIGTTITAVLAALVTNKNGKRVAFFHFLFNMVSVSLVLIFFFLAANSIMNLACVFTDASVGQTSAIPLALTMFHTAFNFSFALLFFPFTDIIFRMIFGQSDIDETVKVKRTDYKVLAGSEISLIHATESAVLIHERLLTTYDLTLKLFEESKDDKFQKILESIRKKSDKTNRREQYLNNSVISILPDDLSTEGNRKFQHLIRQIRIYAELSIMIQTLTDIIEEKKQNHIWFTPAQRQHFYFMWNQCRECVVSSGPSAHFDVPVAEWPTLPNDTEATRASEVVLARFSTVLKLMCELSE